MNNLKISVSDGVVQVIQQALMICGIAGYRNDSPYSVGRHLRDALSAALMVSKTGSPRVWVRCCWCNGLITTCCQMENGFERLTP